MVFCVLKTAFRRRGTCLFRPCPRSLSMSLGLRLWPFLLFRESAVFVADRLWDCDAEPVSNCQKVSRPEEGFRGVLGD